MNKKIITIVAIVIVALGALIIFVWLKPWPGGRSDVAMDPGQALNQGPEEQISPLGNLIRVSEPQANQVVRSPLIIKGAARGMWYFEAVFPVTLLDSQGKEIARGQAQAKSDWMTEEFVPFEARLEFSSPSTAGGTLILENDNPSGLPENHAEIRLPVIFF